MDKFLKPIELVEFSAAPSNPPAGSRKVYARTDGKLYQLTNAGVETELTSVAGGSSPIQVISLASDAASNATTAGVKIAGLDLATLTGTYVFQYFIRYQSSALTTGVKFGVNHTGTTTVFVANMRYASTGGAAATAAATQNGANATGNIHESFSRRVKSTTAPNLGPTVSVDTINSDMFVIIEGLMVITVAGNIELWHGSETANSTTVKQGSSLILTKTA